MTGRKQFGIRGALTMTCVAAGMAVGVSLAAQTTLPAGEFVVGIPDGRSCMGIKATKVCPAAGGACNGTDEDDVIVGSNFADSDSRRRWSRRRLRAWWRRLLVRRGRR